MTGRASSLAKVGRPFLHLQTQLVLVQRVGPMSSKLDPCPRLKRLIFCIGIAATFCSGASARPMAIIDFHPHKATHALDDPEKLFSKLLRPSLPKSDFETDVQYRTRLDALRPSGTFFVLVEPAFTRYVYQAETQRLVVMARQTDSWVTIASTSRNLGKIPMQNAFGASVDTKIYKQRSLQIAITDPPMSFPQGVVWSAKSDMGLVGFGDDVGIGLPVFLGPAAAKRAVEQKSLGLVIWIQGR